MELPKGGGGPIVADAAVPHLLRGERSESAARSESCSGPTRTRRRHGRYGRTLAALGVAGQVGLTVERVGLPIADLAFVHEENQQDDPPAADKGCRHCDCDKPAQTLGDILRGKGDRFDRSLATVVVELGE